MKGKAWLYGIAGILLGVLSWAFYRLLYTGAGDILTHFGITNEYGQNAVVIFVIMVIVVLVFGLSEGGKRIVNSIK